MNKQIKIIDLYGRPDYKGSKDEIIRLSIESRFTDQISLFPCSCGTAPNEMFRSCKEYFIECPACKSRTKYHRHLYEAMHAWNMEHIN